MVLPAPGGPTIATVSPGATERVKPFKTLWPPVEKCTSLKCRPGSAGKFSVEFAVEFTVEFAVDSSGASASTSASLSKELIPICMRTYWLVSMERVDVIVVRYAVNATNWPMEILPWMASMPPAMMVTTSATLGSWESIGWKRAVSFAARIFTA